MIDKAEIELKEIFDNIDDICKFNSKKVLDAFHKNKLSETHFSGTTGYGYNDSGREIIESIYSDIFKSEDSLVRSQFISGTHALNVTLFGLLRPNDILLSITGKPYDTLDEVIGIRDNPNSLKAFGIRYEQIELINDDFDYEKIKKVLVKSKVKVIEIQRSKGYSVRKSITIEKLQNVCTFIKDISKDTIIMVDNCYCEFVSKKEPIEIGADIAIGSLIKNLGAGITPNGAYVCGKKELVKLVSERLNAPGIGKEAGPTLGMNKLILQGLYFAPSVVRSSLKTVILASKLLEERGYRVEPRYCDERADIVQTIILGSKEKLIRYCKIIQSSSAIDSYVSPEPYDMPGYDDKIIMASGSFTQGSSIELSCDGPLREPYVAYMQGSLTYEYGKIAVLNVIESLEE